MRPRIQSVTRQNHETRRCTRGKVRGKSARQKCAQAPRICSRRVELVVKHRDARGFFKGIATGLQCDRVQTETAQVISDACRRALAGLQAGGATPGNRICHEFYLLHLRECAGNVGAGKRLAVTRVQCLNSNQFSGYFVQELDIDPAPVLTYVLATSTTRTRMHRDPRGCVPGRERAPMDGQAAPFNLSDIHECGLSRQTVLRTGYRMHSDGISTACKASRT